MSVPTYTTGGNPAMRDGLLDLFGETEWQDRALCAEVDMDLFFPEKGQTASEAKQVCMGCEVKEDCLEYALDNRERFGIWGGLSERERRKLQATHPASLSPAAAATKAMEEVIRLGMRTIDIEKRFGVSDRTVGRNRNRLADQAVAEAA